MVIASALVAAPVAKAEESHSASQSSEAWSSAHGMEGRVLPLTEAADLATEEWKAMAAGLTATKE